MSELTLEANCRMTRVGEDRAYYDLVYFEYAEGAGAAWFAEAVRPNDRT